MSLTKREKIAGGVITVLASADADSYRHVVPWRGVIGGLALWLFVLWLDADPEKLARDGG